MKTVHKGSVVSGGSPTNSMKTRRLRRSAQRNALQDLYLILLIYAGDVAQVDPGLAGCLRENLNAWAKMYALMGGSWSYGESKTNQHQAVETAAVEAELDATTY